MSKKCFLLNLVVGIVASTVLGSPLNPWIPADMRSGCALGSLFVFGACSYPLSLRADLQVYSRLFRIGHCCLFGAYLLDRMALSNLAWGCRILGFILVGWAARAYLSAPPARHPPAAARRS